jgi:hypothetical protein
MVKKSKNDTLKWALIGIFVVVGINGLSYFYKLYYAPSNILIYSLVGGVGALIGALLGLLINKAIKHTKR